MADYYPLISRAVAALEKNNGENRRALYDRARAALLAQLRGITPPLNESDITRERLALEESIRKVEAEAARRFAEPSRQPPAPKIRPIEPRARETPAPPVAPRRTTASPAPTAAPAPAPASLRPQARQAPPETAHPTPRIDAQPQARTPARGEPSPQPRATPPLSAKKPAVPQPVPAEPALERLATGEAQMPTARHPLRGPLPKRELLPAEKAKAPVPGWEAPVREAESSPAWGAPDFPSKSRPQPAAAPENGELRTLERPIEEEHARDARPRHVFDEPMLEPSMGLDDAHGEAHPDELRTFEQEDEHEHAPKRRTWQLPQVRPSPALIRGAAAVLVAGAVLGSLVWQWPNIVDLYRSIRAPAAEAARETPAAAASRPKIADRIEPGNQSTPLSPQTAAAVAQKVVLYEEDPADPNGRRFVGSAIWRTETVTPGPGQPPELAIRADVEVPERKLAMTWSLRRNTDKGLPASHTVEIMFRLPSDFPSGGISNVPGMLMKQAEQTRGVPLAGLAVKVTNGFFLIGLSSVDADKERNVQLLKERAWLDIPVVYNNNRRAILALEKGTPGERVFAEAFKVWKQ
jgi:hypothetical protein